MYCVPGCQIVVMSGEVTYCSVVWRHSGGCVGV